jgi:hypothetical protein
MADAEKKVFSLEEVSGHNHSRDCWLVIGGKVSYGEALFLFCFCLGMAMAGSGIEDRCTILRFGGFTFSC